MPEIELDTRGLNCPLPVLKLEKAIDGLPAGTRVTVHADDPVAKVDIPLYCRQHGHVCDGRTEGDALRFTIVTGGAT